jgi:hypothetical protein
MRIYKLILRREEELKFVEIPPLEVRNIFSSDPILPILRGLFASLPANWFGFCFFPCSFPVFIFLDLSIPSISPH